MVSISSLVIYLRDVCGLTGVHQSRNFLGCVVTDCGVHRADRKSECVATETVRIGGFDAVLSNDTVLRVVDFGH